MDTLSDRNDDDSSSRGFLEELEDVGPVWGNISGSVALQHHAFDGRVEEVCDGVAANWREETEEDNVTIKDRVNTELKWKI